MKTRITVSALLLLLLSACATPRQAQYPPVYSPSLQPTAYQPAAADFAAQATITARQSQDAAATFEAARVRETATSYAVTRVAEEATAQAQAVATGTAQAIAVAATSTTQALAVRSTEQAIVGAATREALSSAATATSASQIAYFEATLAADESLRLDLQRQGEALANDSRRVWNNTWPVIISFALVALAGAAVLWMANWWRHQTPIREVAINGNHVLVTGNYHLLPPPKIERPQPPLSLPAPRGEVEQGETLPRFTVGHVLIAGETGSGKSSAMRAILQHRQRVVVLDPHAAPGAWGDAQVIGGGREFESIGAYMAQMEEMLDERYIAHAMGEDSFDPLTVAVDEMPAIVAELGDARVNAWRKWVREGRKVGLFLVIATQSTRVRTLGIEGEGDVLENFACMLVLGRLAKSTYSDIEEMQQGMAVMRTTGGRRVVRVPHIPMLGSGPDPGPGPRTNGKGNGNGSAHQPIDTPHGVVTPAQVAQILHLKRQGLPNSRIETRVFNQENPGGAAYHKVKAVLDVYSSRVEL